MKMCLHQFVRPNVHVPIEGEGDCRICTTNCKNKECNSHSPVNVIFFVVEESENEAKAQNF